MRNGIKLYLYLASASMLGAAGWLGEAAINRGAGPGQVSMEGMEVARQWIGAGHELRRKDPWNFDNREWFAQFQVVNLTGWRPTAEEPVYTGSGDDPTQPPKALDEIFQLISLMYHNAEGDPETHVVLRYQEDSRGEILGGVEKLPVAGAVGLAANQIPGGRLPRGARAHSGPPGALPWSQPPRVPVTNRLVHHVKVGESLREPFGQIVLVRVAEDANSAFFRRGDIGSQLEEAYKQVLGLDSKLLGQLVARNRKPGEVKTRTGLPPTADSSWIDVPVTTQVSPGRFSISRADDELIRRDPQKLLDRVFIRPYTSRSGNRSLDGIELLKVDAELGQRFGVRTGDVILEVNGEPVRTRSQAIEVGTRLYGQGVREFRVRVTSMGRREERIYIFPDRK